MKLTDKEILDALKAGKAIAYNEKLKDFGYVVKKGDKLMLITMFRGRCVRTFRFIPSIEELENNQWVIVEDGER